MPPKPVGGPRTASAGKARAGSPRTAGAAGSPSPAARPAGKGAASPTPGARAGAAAGTATAPRAGPAKTPGTAAGPATAGPSKAPGSTTGAKGPGAAGPAKNPTPSGSRPAGAAGAPPARNPDGTPRSSAPPTPASRPGGPPPGAAPSQSGDQGPPQQSAYGGPPGLQRQQSMGPNSANRQSPPPPAAQGGPSNAGPKSPPPPPPPPPPPQQQQQPAPATQAPSAAAPVPAPAAAATKPPTRRFVAGASNVIFDVWWSLAPPRAVKADAYFKGSANAPPAVTHVQTIDRSRSRFGVLPGVPQAGSEAPSRRGNPVPGVGAFTGQGRKLLKDPNHPQQTLLDRARDQTEYELNEDLLFCEQRVKAAKGIVEDTKAKQTAAASPDEGSPTAGGSSATNSAPPAGNIPPPPGRASPIPPPPPRATPTVTPAAASSSSPTNESVEFKLKLAEQSLDQWQVAQVEAESRVQAIPFSLEQTKKIVSCASRTACRIARAAYWRWHAVYLRRKRWSERMDILRRTTRNTHMRGTWQVWRAFVSTASRQRREREEADRVHALTMSRWEASVQSHQDRVNDLQRAIGIKKHVLQLHRDSFAPGLERRPAAFAEWKDREQQLEKEIMLLQAELASAVDAFFEVRRHAPEHPFDQQEQQHRSSHQQQQQSMAAAHTAYTAPSPHRANGVSTRGGPPAVASFQQQRARQLPVSAPDAYNSPSAGSPRRFNSTTANAADTSNTVSREEESLMYARAEAAHWRQRCLEMEARGRDDEGQQQQQHHQPSVSQARGGSLEMDEPSISPVHPSHGGSYGTPNRAGRRSPVRAPVGRPQASPVAAAYQSNSSGSFSAPPPPPPQSRPAYHQDPSSMAAAGPSSPAAHDYRQRFDASGSGGGGDWNASGSQFHHNQPQAQHHHHQYTSQHSRPTGAAPVAVGSPYSAGRQHHASQQASPLMPGTVYADEQCVVVRMD